MSKKNEFTILGERISLEQNLQSGGDPLGGLVGEGGLILFYFVLCFKREILKNIN